MREFKSSYLFIIFFCFTLLFSSAANAFSFGSLFNIFHKEPAKAPVTHHTNNKHMAQVSRVKIGVYVLHVGKYDLQDATYPMDFYLIFHCTPACKSPFNFEIMNATQANIRLVTSQAGSLVYRIRADLNKSDNLRDYPFDNHTLDITIENRQDTSDNMVFEADPASTALDPNLSVVGFKLSPNWKAEVTNHYYPVFQQSYSNYQFEMFITRPWLAGILKGLLPALIIVLCNFLALFMKIEHTSQRLGIATSTLIAAAIFHLNLTASLPPLGYITYADMFMLINDLCLLIVLLIVVLTTYVLETKHHALAQKLNKVFAWSIPALWVILQVITWSAFNLTDAVGGYYCT